MKTPIAIGVGILALIGIFFWMNKVAVAPVPQTSPDYKNATYIVEVQPVTLVNGHAEEVIEPGSASKTVTDYFGLDAVGDLNGDGMLDVAFIISQNGGGSGTFDYVVAALKTKDGYTGTNAVLLGDRIAPQSSEIKNGEVIMNYAERSPDEPMTTAPSVGVSKYLKIEGSTLVDVTKPAELPSGIKGTALLGPTCPVMRNPPDPKCADKPYKTSLVVTTPDGSRTVELFSTDIIGTFSVTLPPGEYKIRSMNAPGIKYPYCQSNGVITVQAHKFVEVTVSCDTGIR